MEEKSGTDGTASTACRFLKFLQKAKFLLYLFFLSRFNWIFEGEKRRSSFVSQWKKTTQQRSLFGYFEIWWNHLETQLQLRNGFFWNVAMGRCFYAFISL